MRFRILGPVAASPQTPTAQKIRTVLAVLLTCADQTVSAASLIDELWDDAPPRTAATTLQVYISQLRQILAEGDGTAPGEHDLRTVPPGYRLQVAPEDLDLRVFETRYREGVDALAAEDYTAASERLGQALELWNGAALSGVQHGPILSRAAVRLEELRLTALDRRVIADLRLGRHRELICELMDLAFEHSTREPFHAHLMVALFRSDRRADALGVYTRVRQTLVGELGIEPGVGLTRLHQRILRSDPGLCWAERPAAAGLVGTRKLSALGSVAQG